MCGSSWGAGRGVVRPNFQTIIRQALQIKVTGVFRACRGHLQQYWSLSEFLDGFVNHDCFGFCLSRPFRRTPRQLSGVGDRRVNLLLRLALRRDSTFAPRFARTSSLTYDTVSRWLQTLKQSNAVAAPLRERWGTTPQHLAVTVMQMHQRPSHLSATTAQPSNLAAKVMTLFRRKTMEE
jgi:hypothetical protein